jgi:hypothetical protein
MGGRKSCCSPMANTMHCHLLDPRWKAESPLVEV